MIKQLDITNFQSHKETSIQFDPGVNIIIGESDSGKTAIMRALRWVIWNRPGGDAFRSHWGGETKVELFSNDISVVRRKDKTTINEYQLSTLQEPFVAFGTGVPQEIQAVLNVNEINLQAQFDKPFLLTSSAGEVAVHFNKIAHIDQIDESLKKVQSWLREIEQQIKNKATQISEFEEELLTYSDLDKFEMEVEVLEGLEKQHTNVVNSKNKLNKLITNIEVTEKEIEEKSDLFEIEDSLNNILSLFEQQDNFKNKKRTLLQLIQTIETTEKEIEENESLLEAEVLIDTILEHHNTITPIKEKKRKLNRLLAEIETNETKCLRKKERVLKQEETYKNEMPDICPLCEQQIKKDVCKELK